MDYVKNILDADLIVLYFLIGGVLLGLLASLIKKDWSVRNIIVGIFSAAGILTGLKVCILPWVATECVKNYLAELQIYVFIGGVVTIYVSTDQIYNMFKGNS